MGWPLSCVYKSASYLFPQANTVSVSGPRPRTGLVRFRPAGSHASCTTSRRWAPAWCQTDTVSDKDHQAELWGALSRANGSAAVAALSNMLNWQDVLQCAGDGLLV